VVLPTPPFSFITTKVFMCDLLLESSQHRANRRHRDFDWTG
jgi:hypothetical protein